LPALRLLIDAAKDSADEYRHAGEADHDSRGKHDRRHADREASDHHDHTYGIGGRVGEQPSVILIQRRSHKCMTRSMAHFHGGEKAGGVPPDSESRIFHENMETEKRKENKSVLLCLHALVAEPKQ
jgi:hypothetical protein